MKEAWSKLELPSYLALGLLIAATLLAYANAWPDVLVHDDKYFAGTPRQSEWADLPRFFTEDLWAATGVESGLYRPLLLLSLMVESRIHGDWMAGYHLDNILLHLLVTLAVYGFLRQLPRTAAEPGQSTDLFALLAALVFAVHPVHTEVVDSIFNRSEMLVALAGTAGLWWFMHYLETRPRRCWAGLALCYLLALFSKESGIILPAIAVALVLMLAPGSWTERIRKCLPVFWLLLPLTLYLLLRAHALAHPAAAGIEDANGAARMSAQNETRIETPPIFQAETRTEAPPVSQAETRTETRTETQAETRTVRQALARTSAMLGQARLPTFRILSETIGAWGQSLWLMVWPDPLLLYRDKPSLTQQRVSLVLQFMLLVAAFLLFRTGRYGLLAGLVFFYLALVPSSRIAGIGGTSSDLAERYLYFPSVGLTMSLVSGFRYLGGQRGLWPAVVSALIVLVLLTPLTWNRNNDWASEVRLLENEYHRGSQGPQTLRLLTAAYLRDGKPGPAAEVCDTKPYKGGRLRKYATHCAIAYSQLGRNEDAERAFLQAAGGRSVQPAMYANLALFYLRQGRREDARQQFERAVSAEKDPALQAYRRGEMLALLYPRNRRKLLEARSHFIEAVRLQPRLAGTREWLDRLNQKLGPAP